MNEFFKVLGRLFKIMVGALIGGCLATLAFWSVAINTFQDTDLHWGGFIFGGIIGAVCGAFWTKENREKIMEGIANVLQHYG